MSKLKNELGKLKDSLLTKIIHLSENENEIKAVSNQEFSIMVQGKDLIQIKELRSQHITFKIEELQQIYLLQLYRALPISSANELYNLAVLNDINLSSLEPEPQPSLVTNNDKVETTLAYLSLKHMDKDAINNFSKMLSICKKVFGSNVVGLEQYVRNYIEASYEPSSVVSTAFSELSITDNQPLLHQTWQALLVNDKERIVCKLLKDADNLDKDAPANVEEALIANAHKLFSSVFSKIESLNEANLNNGIDKTKLKAFVVDYYKHTLTSYIPNDHSNITLLEAIENSIKIITLSTIKTKANDQMPELNLPTYNQLVEAEKIRITQILDKKSNIDSSLYSAPESIPSISKTKSPLKKDYYMRKLEVGDLKGFYLGKLVNCCQSMDGTGNVVVRHGMSEPDSGFYVIQESISGIQNFETDKIVGEFWVWLGDDGKSIVFDSFERLGIENNKLCRLFINAAVTELKKIGYTYIGFGLSPSLGSISFNIEVIESPVKIRKAQGYGLENKDVLCEDGEVQNDISNQVQVVSLIELSKLGFISTKDDLDNVLMHAKELGLMDIAMEIVDVLINENNSLFNMLLVKTQINLNSYLLPPALCTKEISSLYQAGYCLNSKALTIFLDAGADINMKDDKGYTPLVIAARHKKVLNILLDKGIDLKAQNKDGYTLLFAAVESNDIENVTKIIKAGIDVNIPFRGRTPLNEAVRGSHIEIVKALLSANADIYASDIRGNTPYDYALWQGDKSEVALLLKSFVPEQSDLEGSDTNLDLNAITLEASLLGNIESNHM